MKPRDESSSFEKKFESKFMLTWLLRILVFCNILFFTFAATAEKGYYLN